MNILILNWRDPKNPKSGGAEIVTFHHAQSWVKKGDAVVWFSSSFPKASSPEVINGITVVRKGNIFTVFIHAVFFYFFSGIRFDIVIDEIHGIPFFTPLYVHKPKIAFIHEIAGEIWDYMYPFPVNWIGKFFERVYLGIYRGVRFWTDAESTIDELVQYGIQRKNCVALPCPASNKVVKALPKKEKNPTFIFVSRLVKMKGIERVLESFSLIVKEEPKAILWIVGGGEEKYIRFLKKIVQNRGIKEQVTFWGKVTEEKKIHLLQRAHILLHASVKEGWGLVVIEAASQGTPSVVYNVAGLRDSVKDNRTGVVIKKNIPQEMAMRSLELYRDKKRYSSFQEQCLLYAKNLTWEKITAESEALLESLQKEMETKRSV